MRHHQLLTAAILVTLTLTACSSASKADDAALLHSGEWRLITMQGEQAGDTPRVTLRFEDDQKLNGRSFVNQYFSSYTLGSDGSMKIGAIGATKMAGPEPLMSKEAAYFDLLEQVDRYEVSRETLVLMRGDMPLLAYGRVR